MAACMLTGKRGKDMTSKKPFDDSNWRSEYLDLTGHRLSILQCEVLEQGPRSLAQSWMLGALHNKWKRMNGYVEPEAKNIPYPLILILPFLSTTTFLIK